MIKSLLFAFTALSLGSLPASAAPEKTTPAKTPAEKVTEAPRKAAETVKKATEAPAKAAETAKKATEAPRKAADTAAKKVTDKKPEELSDSDKALLAHGEKEAAKLTEPQGKQLLELVNKGDDKALQTIPGVGEAKAGNIKAKRPLKTVADIIMVDGIGEATYDGIIAWVKGGMKAEAPAEPATKKAEPKKPEAKEPAKKKTK